PRRARAAFSAISIVNLLSPVRPTYGFLSILYLSTQSLSMQIPDSFPQFGHSVSGNPERQYPVSGEGKGRHFHEVFLDQSLLPSPRHWQCKGRHILFSTSYFFRFRIVRSNR